MSEEEAQPGRTREEFAIAILEGIDKPVNNGTIYPLLAQMQDEFSYDLPWDKQALNNPMANEKDAPGDSTDFNDVGVKNYHSFDTGVWCTVATLTNGLYPELLDAFDIGGPTLLDAIYDSKWGSKPTQQMLSNVIASQGGPYATTIVPGSCL